MKNVWWKQAPAFPTAVGLSAGIVVSWFVWQGQFPEFPLWAWCSGTALVALAIWFIFRALPLVCGIMSLAAGVWMGAEALPGTVPAGLAEKKCTVTGTVENVRQATQSTRVIIDVHTWTDGRDTVSFSDDSLFKVVCTLHTLSPELQPGIKLRVDGIIRPIGTQADTPYRTDYDALLMADGVSGRLSVMGRKWKVTDHNPGALQKFVNNLHAGWLDAIANAGYDEPTTRFLLAALGGETRLLDSDTEEQFRNTGLAHVLAISGLHVGIVIMVLTFLLYPLKLALRVRWRWVFYIITGLSIILYAYASGGAPSVWRAAVMGCVLLGAYALEERGNGFQSLAVAVILLLSIHPLWLFKPGFQFSVAAVLAIAAFSPVLRWVPVQHPFYRAVWTITMIPLVAVAGTMALTMLYFHSFTFNFWIANVLAAMVVPWLIAAGFIGSLLSAAGLSPGVLVEITETLYHILEKIVSGINGLFPDATADIFMSPRQGLFLMCAVGIAAWLLWYGTRRRAWCAVPLAGVLACLAFTGNGEPLAGTEVLIPAHTDYTDVLIIHHGKSYLWSSAEATPDIRFHPDRISAVYGNYFRRRQAYKMPRLINDGFCAPGLTRQGNLLTVDTLKLLRIDGPADLRTCGHVHYAILSGKCRMEMDSIMAHLRADTIVVHPSVRSKRRSRYIHYLDSCGIPYRTLQSTPLVWRNGR